MPVPLCPQTWAPAAMLGLDAAHDSAEEHYLDFSAFPSVRECLGVWMILGISQKHMFSP